MPKKFFIVFISFFLLLSLPGMVLAAAVGKTTGAVNFRSAPNITSSTIYRTLPKGTNVSITQDVNKYWVKINYGNRTGYISKNYVKYSSSQSTTITNATNKANAIISYGKRFLGTPYRFGAEYPKTGKFDCSSFVQYVYAHNGISLPRVSRDQAKKGVYVAKANIRPGDLLFFSVGNSKTIGHVAIYVGNNQILHTYGAGGVKVAKINTYWKNHYITARRVI